MNQLLLIPSIFFFSLFLYPSHNQSPNIVTIKKKDNELFQAFIQSFDQATFPLEIGLNQFQNPKLKDLNQEEFDALAKASRARNLDWTYNDFIPGKRSRFSRLPPDHYEPLALLRQNEDYVALIVAGKRAFSIEVSHYDLLTYTTNGQLISKKTIAQKLGSKRFLTAIIDAELRIVQSKIREGKDGAFEKYDKELAEVLSSGKIFPEVEGEGYPIIPPKPKRKAKQKAAMKNARASL